MFMYLSGAVRGDMCVLLDVEVLDGCDDRLPILLLFENLFYPYFFHFQVPTYMSMVCDPVVVAFPSLVDDPHMRVMLHRTWDQHVQPLEGVRVQEVKP